MDRIILLVSVIVATLATTYLAPADILACRLETRWQHFYANKDANAIRTIQSALQCCGFRSIHDRAWPFKDADHDDTACERALGYTQSCLAGWRREEQTGAWFVLVAALSSILLKFILAHYEPSSRVWYRGDSADRFESRVNEIDDSSSDEARIDGPARRRITDGEYRDNPEPREDDDQGFHPGAGSEDAENWRDNDDVSGGFRNGGLFPSGLRT
ncbi:hypothetical protein FQN54_001353 [Arachnomyces sp. PD_36]|nr:hypothetical protein FQN54_001353 [Arachnomyces sp. PD_36]